MGYHEREHGCYKAVDRQADKDLLFVELLYEERAGGHAYHRAYRGRDAEHGDEVLRAEKNVGGLNLNAHSHLTAEAEEI